MILYNLPGSLPPMIWAFCRVPPEDKHHSCFPSLAEVQGDTVTDVAPTSEVRSEPKGFDSQFFMAC